MTAWSFAAIGVLARPLLNAIAASAIAMLQQFGTQELANTSWSFAKR